MPRTHTIGILGGGQLGRMLIQAAMNLDLRVHVMDPDPEAPCRSCCDEFTWGPITDADAVERFGRRTDLVTIEIENVSAEGLERLQAAGVAVYPQPSVIRTIQDKGEQKLFLQKHGIPTAEFALVAGRKELQAFTKFFPLVQKLRTTGYDGRGVLKITDRAGLAAGFDAPSVVERLVEFDKELAVIVARSAAGETKVYPSIEMIFHPGANLVEYLLSPARVSPAVEKEAERIALDVARELGIVGLAAVEMFVTPAGGVLVNEIAPRPHNSGHHTIEGNATSQFEQHLRAILGLPLGPTAITSPAVMVNILGAEGYAGPARYEGLDRVLAIPGAAVHLYGKEHTKPFRKMGHVTITGDDAASILRTAETVKQTLRVIA
jgi:5-(carboxyamino)imidazole ribonucleotide synthase